MQLIELPDLAVRSPTEIAVPRISHIRARDLREAARCIETAASSLATASLCTKPFACAERIAAS